MDHQMAGKRTDNTRQISPEVARQIVDRFEFGEEPRYLGRGLGGSQVVYGILRAAIRGLRSQNIFCAPLFAVDGFGRAITVIPERRPMGRETARVIQMRRVA